MMSFCKRSVHSFLGTLANSSKDNHGTTAKSPCRCLNIPSPADSLSLIAVTRESQRPTNVVESAVVKSTTSSPTAISAAAVVKKDAGGIGFIDDVGGEVDGLMSCTESLGFESSDERRTDERMEEMNNQDDNEGDLSRGILMGRVKRRRRVVMRREEKKLPPPLSSLNKNGRPSFFLRAVRKDGRLELSEVRIDRPEILRAFRQDGRLRLHLIPTEDIHVKEEEEEDEEIEENIIEEEKEEKNEEERIGEWNFPVSNGGDGFRRCHELVSHQHHHHHHHHSSMHVWRQHCVTTS